MKQMEILFLSFSIQKFLITSLGILKKLQTFEKKLSDLDIKFEHVDNYGGEEQGRDYWSIYSFSNDTDVVYVKFDGWYASYHGSEYDEWYFVEPRQVQVTQFERA